MNSDTEMYEELTFGEDTLCNICNAEFLDFEDLTVHIQQMHKLASKSCQFCSGTYTDLMDYALHIRDSHITDLRSCQYCAKTFLVRSELKQHENKHVTMPNAYSCSQCDSMFPEVGLLYQHERENHNNSSDGIYLQCMPFLSSLLNLKAVSLLQRIGKLNFKCTSCKFSSSNLPVYIKHLRKKKCTGYVCDRCSVIFKTKKNLVKHLRYAKKCLGIKEPGTKCKHCKIEVPDRGLEQHLKTCNVLRCVDCDLECNSIEDLSNHQAKEHPLDMTLIRCKFCLKEFIGQLPLKKHTFRVHYPSFHLYKYKCSDCDVIFKHPQKLFAHFYTRHKELSPFTCKICNMNFRIRKTFSLHIKLNHKSVGFVEFDNQYHVFFTENKSENPFIPECVVPDEIFEEYQEDKMSKRFSIRSQNLETEATDLDTEDEKPLKRKLPIKKKATKPKTVEIYSSDDEPLLEVRKRVLKKKVYGKNWTWKKNKSRKSNFTCNICNKNCFTYQNYRNHMGLHNKGQRIECVKCSAKFKSKEQLKSHMAKEHSTSKLTETLKNLLEKKKHVTNDVKVPKQPEKFRIAMKKVKLDYSTISATIKAVDTNLNVKNFLENFIPESNETSKINVTITTVNTDRNSLSQSQAKTIKLTKFRDAPKLHKPVPLKMPERFKVDDYTTTKVTMKLIPEVSKDYILPTTEHDYETFQDDDKNDIPEVAHEVSLVGTEEPTQPITRIVIPKMPEGYNKIHIATLQSEAPYFKIIKVDSDNLTVIKEKVEEPEPVRDAVIDLPGGTKLVTANPLAHLLGDTPLDKILEPVKNKYYKPVIKDFSGILAQAMQKLEEPPRKRKRKIQKEDEILGYVE